MTFNLSMLCCVTYYSCAGFRHKHFHGADTVGWDDCHPQLLSTKYTTTDSNTSVLSYTHSTPSDMTTIDFQWGRVDRLPLPANSVQTGDGTLIIPDVQVMM